MILICSVFYTSIHAQKKVLNIKDFGAKGNGTADDYPAFLKMADSVNKLGGGEILLPPGNYYLAAYHTAENKIADILFSNCTGISISGTKAIVSLNGNFLRTANRRSGGKYFSKTNSIIPFAFKNCSDIKITGLEVNGNVDKMTREIGVVEGGAPLIRLAQCRNVVIDKVNLHHAESDGIYIIGDSSYNVSITNSVFSNNARQGMSVIGLTKGYFNNCRFINTGITDGNYGRHAPSDGVDIEPRFTVTGLLFESCTFSNNQGGQFICTSTAHTSNIELRNCKMEAMTSRRPFQVILYANNIIVDSCFIDCGKGSVWGSWKKGINCAVEIKNSTIKSATYGIYGIVNDSSNSKLNIHDNKIYCTADTLKYYFPWLHLPHLDFINNKVYFSSIAVLSVSGYTSVVEGKGYYVNNEFIPENIGMVPVVSTIGMQTVLPKNYIRKE